MKIVKKNTAEDFKLLIPLGTGYNGEKFQLTFSTTALVRKTYVASYDGTKYTNCQKVGDNHILVSFDNCGLRHGLLQLEKQIWSEDDSMADGNFAYVSDGPVIAIDDKDEEYKIEICYGKSDYVGISETAATLLSGYGVGTGGGYTAPEGGIPKTDLSADVQASLGKADTAIQQAALTTALAAKQDKITVNNNIITVKVGDKNYALTGVEIVKPATPTIATTAYHIVTGNAEVAITNNTSGATLYYSTDGGTTWSAVSNGKVAIASGFSNTASNAQKTQALWVKAVKNGAESDILKQNITITPKVAAGSIAITRTPNNNDWATAASIVITPSATTGATTQMSADAGTTWATVTEAQTISVSSSIDANKYQVKATKTGYTDSVITKSAAITLNAKKAYYGFSTKSALQASDITALTGSKEDTKLQGALTISPTGTEAGYVWLCVTGTLAKDTIVPNQGDVIPFGFEAAVSVGGWNCYRSTNKISPVSTNVYIP